MGLKILHTADWHLGANLYNASREDEHERFLDWLLETLATTQCDALVVAGDVFHYAHPSAEALRLYYRFLSRLGEETKVRQAVIVGGNHDSPARLDAPREILETLHVHVVGGLGSSKGAVSRCLCPLRGVDGEVACVVAGVPYVHEFRLGVKTTDRPLPLVKADIEAAFGKLYREAADAGEQGWPGVPLLATAHLTCAGVPPEEYGTPIHMAALLGGLPPTLFDPRFGYVALGHIHQCFPVQEDRPVWYSGSPVPLNAEEARYPQHVLLLDVDGTMDAPRIGVEKVRVPRWRELVELKGSKDELLAKLMSLTSRAELPPFLYADMLVDHYTVDVARPMLEALAVHPSDRRPRILRVSQTLKQIELEADANALPSTSLKQLDPVDVFSRLVRIKQQSEPRAELLQAFREILAASD